MTQLITNLDQAFEFKSKIDFIEDHYSGENDVLLGVTPDTEEGRYEAHQIISQFLKNQKTGWKKGEIVNGKEIEFVSSRVDHVSDFYMPDYLRRIEDESIINTIKKENPDRIIRTLGGTEYANETIEEMEARTGKKCAGSKKNYLTVCVCRRFKNPMNEIPPMIDDEDQGVIPADSVKLIDDTRYQI